MSSEDTQKVAKCPLFQCPELKGGSRRPNQPKTIFFRPHLRSTLADPNPTDLTEDLFFGDYYFRRAKTEELLFFMDSTIFDGQTLKTFSFLEAPGFCANFTIQKWCSPKKKVFSPTGCPISSTSLVVWLGFSELSSLWSMKI